MMIATCERIYQNNLVIIKKMMKTQISFKIEPHKILSMEELKSLKGGNPLLCFYNCMCYGTPNPPFTSPFSLAAFSISDTVTEINTRCSSGGSCAQDFCV
jgi:hypothetical protein